MRYDDNCLELEGPENAREAMARIDAVFEQLPAPYYLDEASKLSREQKFQMMRELAEAVPDFSAFRRSFQYINFDADNAVIDQWLARMLLRADQARDDLRSVAKQEARREKQAEATGQQSLFEKNKGQFGV